jgi:hypothetical protein
MTRQILIDFLELWTHLVVSYICVNEEKVRICNLQYIGSIFKCIFLKALTPYQFSFQVRKNVASYSKGARSFKVCQFWAFSELYLPIMLTKLSIYWGRNNYSNLYISLYWLVALRCHTFMNSTGFNEQPPYCPAFREISLCCCLWMKFGVYTGFIPSVFSI